MSGRPIVTEGRWSDDLVKRAYLIEVQEAAALAAEPKKRTPLAHKLARARQAELYVRALGLKGACEAMGLGPWQIWSLRRWLAGGPITHNRAGRFKRKLSDETVLAIFAARGREKLHYLAAASKLNPATIVRIWNGQLHGHITGRRAAA